MFEKDEVRTRTLMRAMYSGDSTTGAGMESVADSFRGSLFAAIGDELPRRRDAVVDTLGLVLHGAILAWLSGRYDAADVRRLLDAAVELVFRGVDDA